MARPIKEGLDYFPHDTDASTDEKVEALRSLHGNNGYAFYFILLERIYRTPDFEIDISDAETTQILAKKCGINSEEFRKILATALKYGCFDRQEYAERGVLTSSGVKKRASIVTRKREEMREKYLRKGVSASETHQETREETHQEIRQETREENTPETMDSASETRQEMIQETHPETPQRKEKERKENIKEREDCLGRDERGCREEEGEPTDSEIMEAVKRFFGNRLDTYNERDREAMMMSQATIFKRNGMPN